MAFNPDPKPTARVKTANPNDRLKRYSCIHCHEKYEMTVREYGQRSMTARKKHCKKLDCEVAAGTKWLEKKKAETEKAKRKAWNNKKESYKKELGIKTRDSKDVLQIACNKIARLLDEGLPCLANPTHFDSSFDGGHVFGTGTCPALRYNLWNIHAQGTNSNRSQKDDLKMLEGVEIRYGLERRQWLESLRLAYPVLKLKAYEKREALKNANQIIRELEKGATLTRDEVNRRIGIYTKEY